MAEFCRHHGFYAPCPSCTGEEVIWEIPIIDCAGGGGSDIDSRSRKVDVLRVSAGVYEDAMTYEGAQTVVAHAPSPRVESLPVRSSEMPPARDHIPLPVNPGLYARVKTILHRHQ